MPCLAVMSGGHKYALVISLQSIIFNFSEFHKTTTSCQLVRMAASTPLINQVQFSDDESSNVQLSNDGFDAQEVFEINEVRSHILVVD